jgi:hypothetical protein
MTTAIESTVGELLHRAIQAHRLASQAGDPRTKEALEKTVADLLAEAEKALAQQAVAKLSGV